MNLTFSPYCWGFPLSEFILAMKTHFYALNSSLVHFKTSSSKITGGFLFLPTPHPIPTSHQLRPALQWRSGRGFLHPLLSFSLSLSVLWVLQSWGWESKEEEEVRSCSHTWLVSGWYYLQFFLGYHGTCHALHAILGSFRVTPWGPLQCTVY